MLLNISKHYIPENIGPQKGGPESGIEFSNSRVSNIDFFLLWISDFWQAGIGNWNPVSNIVFFQSKYRKFEVNIEYRIFKIVDIGYRKLPLQGPYWSMNRPCHVIGSEKLVYMATKANSFKYSLINCSAACKFIFSAFSLVCIFFRGKDQREPDWVLGWRRG